MNDLMMRENTDWIIQNGLGSPEHEEAVLEEEQIAAINQLIVWNDDVNTFDHVINSLIEICDHSPEQAEQCSLLIHFKGKCAVKSGAFNKLRPLCEALIDRRLSATID